MFRALHRSIGRTVRLVAWGLISVFCLATPSFAQSVPVSLKPYADAYQAAVNSRDKVAIADAAQDLWQATEDELGDDVRTGAMAHLYARRAARLPTSRVSEKNMRKAFKRSVELAALSTENPFEVDVKRRLDWIEAESQGAYTKPVDKDIAALRARLEAWTSADTIYYADLNAIDAAYAINKKRDVSASLLAGATARRAYNALDAAGSSRALKNYETLARVIPTADSSLIEQALLAQEYTDVAVGRSKSKRHKIQSITLYRAAEENLVAEGEMLRARAKGFLRPDIGSLLEDADLDVLKVHPRIPVRATGSGYAELEITVLEDGRVGDVKVLSETHEMFGAEATKAVRQWHYNMKRHPQNGEPIIERITFDLYGTYGERL